MGSTLVFDLVMAFRRNFQGPPMDLKNLARLASLVDDADRLLDTAHGLSPSIGQLPERLAQVRLDREEALMILAKELGAVAKKSV